MLKRISLWATALALLIAAALSLPSLALVNDAQAQTEAPIRTAKSGHAINFSSHYPMIDTRNALIPYQPPSGEKQAGAGWYMFTAVNDDVRPVTRILKPVQPAGIGLRFFPSSTRPEILQVASPESSIGIEATNAYGRKSYRITIPPATSGTIALLLHNTATQPGILAWTEPALAGHNRQLAILLAAVAGLIAAAGAIMAGIAVMTGHLAPRWAAIFIFSILLTRLASSGMFDASLATGVGGPYGLIAAFACLTLAAGLKLTDIIVPISALWPRHTHYLKWVLRGLIALALMSLVGLPGATIMGNLVTVIGTGAIAYYLIDRGRNGVQTARVVAPSATIFFLVAAAAAVGASGGFGNNLIAPAAVGGFSAAGTVLLALAIAAGEGIAILPPLHLPHLPNLSLGLKRHSDQPSDPAHVNAAAAVSAAQQGVFDLDLQSGTLTLTPHTAHILHLEDGTRHLALGEWLARIHPQDRATFQAAIAEYGAQSGLAFRMEFRAQTAAADYAWYELRASMLGEQVQADRCLGLLADVTLRKQAETVNLPVSPRNDPLTGLGNRLAMMTALEEQGQALQLSTFIMLDIDRFKSIHSSLGDAGADFILSDIAHRLTTRFGALGKIFRVGGDSFALLLPHSQIELADLGTQLVQSFAEPHSIEDRSIYAQASIGLALGRDAEDPLELLQNVELALLHAKRQGGNCARFFDPEFTAVVQDDAVRLESDLRLALDHNQLDIFYQPIIRLSDSTLAGFEALLRWHHPTKGLISPSDFISHSEASGLIVTIGRFALERAIQDMSHWQQSQPHHQPLFVSVNVSRRQFRDPSLINFLAGLMQTHAIVPGTLKIEVTESAVAADPETKHLLEKLRDLGAGLSLDDFGTGLSNLSQLKNLPFDTLKIDQTFLSRHGSTQHEDDGTVILGSIVSLAHELKRQVIIEGVETEADAQWLQSIGCEYAQGFYFAPPLPASEAFNYIVLQNEELAAQTQS